jgi:hypothetical protein
MKNRINNDLKRSEEQHVLFEEKLLTALDKVGDKVDAHYCCSAPSPIGGCCSKKEGSIVVSNFIDAGTF